VEEVEDLSLMVDLVMVFQLREEELLNERLRKSGLCD